MRNRRLLLAATAALCLGLGTVNGTPAGAESSDPVKAEEKLEADVPADVLDLYTPQQRERNAVVGPLAQEIERLAGVTDEWVPGHPRQVEGYLLDVASDGALDLYWKGPLPPAVQALIDAHPRVRVTVHEVPYDEDEFLGAQALIMDRLRADPPQGATLDMIDHAPGRSALRVVMLGSLDADQVVALEERIATWTDIPAVVEVVNQPSLVPL
jgi:hypothetical protein